MAYHPQPKDETPVAAPPPPRLLSAQWDSRSTFSVPEAAEILGLSPFSAWAAVKAGYIPTIRIGRRVIVPRHALERLLSGA